VKKDHQNEIPGVHVDENVAEGRRFQWGPT